MYFQMYSGFVSSKDGKTYRHRNDCRGGRFCTHRSLEIKVTPHHAGPGEEAPESGRERVRRTWTRAFTVVFVGSDRLGWTGLEWDGLNSVSGLWAMGWSPVIWYLALGDLGQQGCWLGGWQLDKGEDCHLNSGLVGLHIKGMPESKLFAISRN